MKRRVDPRQLCVTLFLFAAASFARTENVYVIGPIEQISAQGTLLVVLGQQFLVDPHTRVLGKSSADASTLKVGSLVAIEGHLSAGGTATAEKIALSDESYVPGSTNVAGRGVILSVDATTGEVRVGTLRINLAVTEKQIQIDSNAVGSYLDFVGLQALPGGPLWVSQFELLNDATATGVGARTQSISGTGAQALSIAGTGVQTQSITGTGRQTQSISGTGVQALSITGTGVQTQSITGTGRQTQSIAGTGRQTQSITGTGAQALSITGTGAQTQSIAGTGR